MSESVLVWGRLITRLDPEEGNSLPFVEYEHDGGRSGLICGCVSSPGTPVIRFQIPARSR